MLEGSILVYEIKSMDNLYSDWWINFLVSFYMGDMNFWPSLINGLIGFVGSVIVGEGLKKVENYEEKRIENFKDYFLWVNSYFILYFWIMDC